MILTDTDILVWCSATDSADHAYTAYVSGYVTVGKVLYAEEGEAEGGLGAFVRFMGGALRPEVKQPPLSPSGWYWSATTEERGRWSKGGPFASPEEARDACTEAFRVGGYLRDEYNYKAGV